MNEETEGHSDEDLSLLDLYGPFDRSYMVVQEQMRDLIAIQETAIGNIAKSNMETLNVSQEYFDATLRNRDKQIEFLEGVIATEHVPRGRYEALVENMEKNFVPRKDLDEVKKLFQDECENHAQTQASLENNIRELDHAQDTIKSMECEKQKTLATFGSAYNELRQELSEMHAKCNMLQSKLAETQMVCEQQKEQICDQQEKLEALELRQQSQKQKFKQKLIDTEVEKQQEAYLQRMMAEGGKRKAKKQ